MFISFSLGRKLWLMPRKSCQSTVGGIKLVRNYAQMRVLSFPGDEKSGGRWWKDCFRSSSMSRPMSCES